MALRQPRRRQLPLLPREHRSRGRLAARMRRLWQHMFTAMSEFGFTATGVLPPHGTHREEPAAPQCYSEDELLWMAELEERDFR